MTAEVLKIYKTNTHNVGLTHCEFNVKASNICRVTCVIQGLHKAKTQKVLRNMDSKEKIMEG